MTKEQALHFFKSLLTDVWENLDDSKIADYYHKDVVVYFGQQKATYDDIVHRLHHVKNTFGSLHNNIKDILVDGDKIAVHLEQTLGTSKPATIVAIYHLKDNKVSHLQACIDPAIDYFE